MLDHVAPRWIFGVEQQRVSQLGIAGLGQLLQQIRRAEKACSQQIMIGMDFVCQFLGGRGAQPLREQIHVQRQHVAGLRVSSAAFSVWIVDGAKGRRAVVRSGHKAVGLHELFFKRGANLFKELLVLFLGLVAARGMGHLAHQRNIIGPISC